MGINAKLIDDYILQIEETTECSALREIIEGYLKDLEQLIKDILKEQKRIFKKFFPPSTAPGPNPFAIVSWIKKFLAGTIIPQLEAHIKLVVDAVILIGALTRLQTAITQVAPRVRACAVESATNFINEKINEAITEATESLNESLIEINSIQDSIEELLGEALTTRIDTTNLPEFLKDPLDKLNDIQQQVNTFIDTPIVETIVPGTVFQLTTDGSVQWAFPDPGELI